MRLGKMPKPGGWCEDGARGGVRGDGDHCQSYDLDRRERGEEIFFLGHFFK